MLFAFGLKAHGFSRKELGEGVRSRDDATEDAREPARELVLDPGPDERCGASCRRSEGVLEGGRELVDGVLDRARSAEAAREALCRRPPIDRRSSSSFFTCCSRR